MSLIPEFRCHEIITNVQGDPDQAERATFTISEGGGGKARIVGIDAVIDGRKALDDALEAVVQHDVTQGAFNTERAKGNEADVWRLQTLRKATRAVHDGLPTNLR